MKAYRTNIDIGHNASQINKSINIDIENPSLKNYTFFTEIYRTFQPMYTQVKAYIKISRFQVCEIDCMNK